jgi:hypothetical protein
VSRIIGIYREPECSPGRHRSNDALLLEAIGGRLAAAGATVALLPFDEAASHRRDASLIFSMCQGPHALAELVQWEREDAAIVNSPTAALNTYRDRLPGLLDDAGVPFPATRMIATASLDRDHLPLARAHWLKRGDVHASVASDVQRIDSIEALRDGLSDFRARGIVHAVLQEHRSGAEIKFYGVRGTGFFHWFFTSGADDPRVSTAPLHLLAERAAAAAGLDIYGGDVIVEPSGALTLIDLNDWPSFAPCRDAAADALVDFLMRRVHAAWNTGLVPSANQSAV